MSPYSVLPVWSVNGPSRHDGVSVGSLCEPLLACHSIRFSRFKLQRIPCISCGFARCVPPSCVRRQGDTLLSLACRVNGLSELFSSHFQLCSFALSGELKTPPDLSRKAPTHSMSAACTRRPELLCKHLRAAFRFQHTLRSLVASGGAADEI